MKKNHNKIITFFNISISGINIQIECKHRYVFSVCRNYLSSHTEPDIVIPCVENEIEDSRRIIEINPDSSLTTITTDADPVMENMIILRKIADSIVFYDLFLLHGAVIAKDGFAYLFTADSGVGKTTRAELWMKEYPESYIVNGDKPFIKIDETNILACGTPWCGKERWNTNISVPLRAIFLLERSNDERTTSISEITLGKAFPFLLRQAHRPEDPDAMRRTIEL